MNNKILRIIDANVNRAAEGIRVVEDVLRFFYNQPQMYTKLRILRHRLVNLFLELYPELVSSRNSVQDPGRNVVEKKYTKSHDLVFANLHRVTESLRVLEEISKLVNIKKVMKVKSLRYKIYDIEKEVVQLLCKKK